VAKQSNWGRSKYFDIVRLYQNMRCPLLMQTRLLPVLAAFAKEEFSFLIESPFDVFPHH
jgi:hypothetical protein